MKKIIKQLKIKTICFNDNKSASMYTKKAQAYIFKYSKHYDT